MWDWHTISLDGFPGWETFKDGGFEMPASVFISSTVGKGRGSRELAIETDDWAKGQFYYRDWTSSGIPMVQDGEIYHSRFWFQLESDAKEFAVRYKDSVVDDSTEVQK